MRIVRFFAENVKRVKVVEIIPKKDAGMVVIGGQNDAGKSSCLDAIEFALGGKGTHPKEPLRKGAKKGRVILDLGDLIVTRTFAAGGATALQVESKAGKTFSSPQAMLDKLYGELTFDPLSFERQDAKEQAAVLRTLVGLDFSALDKLRDEKFGERTLENKSLRALEVSVAALERFEDAPAEEVSVQALSSELAAAEALAKAAADAEAIAANAESKRYGAAREAQAAEEEVARLDRQLSAAKGRHAALLVALDAALSQAQELSAEAVEAGKGVPDTAPLHQRLKEAESLNAKVRTNRQADAQAELLRTQRSVCADLSHEIEAIDEEKARQLAAAKYPVEGLGIDESGAVLFAGLPFEQASTSDRIRVSVAMGLALHPTLRILLVRDGSLIGEAKLKLIEDMVKAADAQLWLEMMQEAPSGRTTVFIEDGLVAKEPAGADAAK